MAQSFVEYRTMFMKIFGQFRPEGTHPRSKLRSDVVWRAGRPLERLHSSDSTENSSVVLLPLDDGFHRKVESGQGAGLLDPRAQHGHEALQPASAEQRFG